MVSKPAARAGDLTAHGSILKPSPGSPNVLIGGKPAWRGLSPAGAAQLAKAITKVMKSVTKFTTATNNNNAPVAADALEEMKEGISTALKIMASVDQNFCETPLIPPIPVPPHANGVVITGSTTVLINGLPACRQGDTIQETVSVNTIAAGCSTVLIGG